MSHRLVRCTACDLVYAAQPPTGEQLAQAYHQADYDSAQEADDAAAAYIRAPGGALRRLPSRQAALEIGTGTGVFLQHLREHGFEHVVGVEPSTAAIAAAPPHRQAWIREGMFDEADFTPESFDQVCCFMTLEHVRDPLQVARSALRLLRPGGAFAAVTHDYRSFVNRTLGRRSPIIDVEHLQLFSAASVRRLFETAGFTDVGVQAFPNRYRLSYWLRLLPLPGAVKDACGAALQATGAGELRLSANVGNVFVSGFRHA
jgi:SAM-dependent methyltransferase